MSDVLDGLDEVIEAPTPEAAATPAPAAEATPAPEPAAVAPAPVEKPAEAKEVPLAAHIEERNALKAEVRREREQRLALEERIRKLETPAPVAVAPQPVPDFVEDPKGYVDHRVTDALAKLEEAGKRVETVQKTAEEANNEARMMRFVADLGQTEAQFRQTTPDYYDALGHLREVRAAQIKTFAPEISDAELIQQIRSEELQLATTVTRQGRNPHQIAYDLAKAAGYRPKDAKPAAPPVPVVAEPTRLPPDQTLGTTGAAPGTTEDVPEVDEFDVAFRSMFKKRA